MADENKVSSLATPIAIVVAGLIIAGAVYLTNGESNSSSQNEVVGLGSKYEKHIALAAELGLDAEEFSQCMDEFKSDEVKNDAAEAARIGANGTPAFFIGRSNGDSITGVRVAGAFPIETFRGIIQGLMEDNDQMILEAIGPDQEGNLPESVEAISQSVSLGDDPVKGDANAPITIVEFSDYECPFCQRNAQVTYPQLVEEFIETGQVKLVYRDLPLSFHEPKATQAAVAANCAREQGGDEAYFEYHDEYFTRTQSNGQGL